MNKKGITLIELLIVVAIIGILAAVSVPLYTGQQKRAKRAEAYANLQAIRLLEEQFYAENGEYAPNDKTTSDTTTGITGVSAIQAYIPGFKPDSNMNYDYSIRYTVDVSGAANANTTGFEAHASGKSGTQVSGDVFCLNQDNSKELSGCQIW